MKESEIPGRRDRLAVPVVTGTGSVLIYPADLSLGILQISSSDNGQNGAPDRVRESGPGGHHAGQVDV